MEKLEQSVKYSRLIIKTPERRHWRYSGVFIVNLENILHLFLVILLLNFSMQMPAGEWQIGKIHLPYFRLIFFSILPENIRKPRFRDVFREYKKEILV